MMNRNFSVNLVHFLPTSSRLVALRRHWLASVTLSESRRSYRILTQKLDPLLSAGPNHYVTLETVSHLKSAQTLGHLPASSKWWFSIFYFPLVRNSCVLLLNYIRKKVKDVLGAVRAPQMNFLNCPFGFLCKKWSITMIVKSHLHQY